MSKSTDIYAMLYKVKKGYGQCMHIQHQIWANTSSKAAAVICLLHKDLAGWYFPHWSSMMTSSNGNIFRVTGSLCGEFTGPGEFPTQRPVTRSFDVFFDLRLNKRLSKQPWGWWFETPSWSLRRQCNGLTHIYINELWLDQIMAAPSLRHQYII